jgi:hypothetical protein
METKRQPFPDQIRLNSWIGGCFVWLTCLQAGSDAQQAAVGTRDPIEWRTGAELQKQLTARISIQWKEAELRPRLESLSADQRVAVFLDRRIDPSQKFDFARTGVTLEDLFGEVAGAAQAAREKVGSVIYIGPPPTAAALAKALLQRRKDVSRRGSLGRARPQPLRWDELAEPRQLLDDIARQHQLTIVNPEAVPHDLWPAADLPPLSLAEQLTLLLAGFDLTFEVSSDGRQLRFVPLSIDAIAAPVSRRPGGKAAAKESSPGNTSYTLTVTNESAGAVVSKVAERLGRQLQCSASVREKLATKVNLKVSDASLDELMDKTLTPLGLAYRLTEETLEVAEKE